MNKIKSVVLWESFLNYSRSIEKLQIKPYHHIGCAIATETTAQPSPSECLRVPAYILVFWDKNQLQIKLEPVESSNDKTTLSSHTWLTREAWPQL